MFGLMAIAAFGVWALYYKRPVDESGHELPSKISERMGKLWSIASDSIKERKYLRAEKALLTILRVDERNANAYSRLGILYAKQRAYQDAIECFEIAQSLEPSVSSLHNVGLIYYETGVYDKAALAFEQALEMEENLATRHVAYAKVQEKLGDTKKMISSLERAVELEPNPQSLGILAEAYEQTGRPDLADGLRKKAKQMLESTVATPKRIVQPPRRIVM